MLIIQWLVLCISLLLVSAYSDAQPQPQTAQPKKAAKAERLGSEKFPLSVQIVPTTDAEKKAAEEKKHQKEKADEDRWLTNSTIWLAGVTTILAFFTALLWLATYRLVKGSKDTAERQLRAYIGACQFTIAPFKSGQPDVSQVHMKNYGQTPAHKTTIVAAIDIFPWPLPEHHKLPPLPSPGAACVLFPTAELDYPARPIRAFSDKEVDAAVEGQDVRFYVFGVVKYIDAINEHEPRETHFCVSYSGGAELRKVKNGGLDGALRFEIAHQHNYAT
jgi:hypothetical protein